MDRDPVPPVPVRLLEENSTDTAMPDTAAGRVVEMQATKATIDADLQSITALPDDVTLEICAL